MGQLVANTLQPSRARLELLIATAALGLTLAAYFSPLAVALLLGAVVVVLASFRFRPLVLAVILVLPVNPYLSWDLPIKDLGTLLRLCLFAGTVVARQRSGESLVSWLFAGKLNRVLLGYFAVAVAASTIVNPPTAYAARELMRFASYLCLYYTVVDWVRTESDFKAVFTTLMFSTIGVALFGFYQFLAGDYSRLYEALFPIQEEVLRNPPWSGRITSFLSHYNGLAAYLNMVIPFCAAFALRSSDVFLRKLSGVCFVLASVAVALTQSRGGLLAYGAVLLVCAWFLAPSRRVRRRWLIALAIAAAVSAVALGMMFERLSGLDEFTEVTRLAIWAGAGVIFLGHPVAGIGYGNFKLALAGTITVAEGAMIDAHNLYLELLAETGIVGFVAFAVMAVTFLRSGLRMHRHARNEMDMVIGVGVMAAIAGVLVHGGVDYIFHNTPQFAALFFLLPALLKANESRQSGALALAGEQGAAG